MAIILSHDGLARTHTYREAYSPRTGQGSDGCEDCGGFASHGGRKKLFQYWTQCESATRSRPPLGKPRLYCSVGCYRANNG